MLKDPQYIQINQSLFSLTHEYETRMLKDARAREAGLRLSDCAVIMVLGQMEPLTASQLSSRMSINPGTISLYVQRLVEKGLVVRERDKSNRRLWWLTLTQPGHDAYKAIIEGTAQYTREFLSTLDNDDQAALHGLLLKASHGIGFDW
ncbi:MAG: MarR family transcriptional regulator [Dehalococcoidia bacterium]|nr:MarR family transcriptional regulator [Dehalococcoidia bacterium]